MTRRVTAGQWAAVRALREIEEPATAEQLADAVGLTVQACFIALQNFRRGIMHAVLSATQLVAMQELLNGKAHTQARLAALIGYTSAALGKREREEEWRPGKIRDRSPHDGLEAEIAALADDEATPELSRAARVSALLLKHADQLLAEVERQGGTLTKEQLDTMLAMVRLAEKFEPLARKEESDQQKKSDNEIAELLDQIDQLIRARARAYAEELVERQVAGRETGGAAAQLAADRA